MRVRNGGEIMKIFGKAPAPGAGRIDFGTCRIDYEIARQDAGYRLTGRISGNPGRIEVLRTKAPEIFLMNNWQSWGPMQKVSRGERFPEFEEIRQSERGYLFSPIPEDFRRTLISDYFAGWDGSVLGFLTSHDAHPFFAVEGDEIVGYLEYFGADLGDGTELEPLVVLVGKRVEDLLEEYGVLAGSANSVALNPWNPVGWCSWYQYFGKLTWTDVLKNLDIADRNPAFPFDVFQIDDGYEEDIGDWDKGRAGYPTLEEMARAIRSKGFKAGIWTAPFSAAETSDLFHKHPDWMVSEKGLPKVAYRAWGKAIYALDTTHAEAKRWLYDTFAAQKKVGFEYFKIDFLFAAAIPGVRARNVTPIRAYREGLETVRQAVGRSFVLGCGAPLLPSAGLVDGMRIGEDTAPYWKTKPSAFQGPNAFFALRNAIMRQFMHGRLWLNDPDCILLRSSDIGLSGNERQLFALAAGAMDNMIIASDDLSLVAEHGKALLETTLGMRGGKARVRGLLGDGLYLIESKGGPAGDITMAANLEDKAVSWKGKIVPARRAIRLP
ncbi:alpha-galactosidase [bacterium]|nr:MAG: alpha-galactosidase [bacterium]